MSNGFFSAAGVAAGLLAVAGCASADAAPAADPAKATATYTRLVDDIDGTRQQRIYDEKLIWAELNQSTLDCMKKAGLEYEVPGFIVTGNGPSDPGDLTSIVPLGLPGFGITETSESVHRATRNESVFSRLATEAEQRAYGKTLGGCFSAAPTRGRWYPAGAMDLRRKVVKIFQRIEKRPAVEKKLAEYGSCMKRAGFPGTYGNLRDEVYAKLLTKETTWAEVSTTVEWRQVVAYEKAAATADTRCRTDLHDTVMVLGAAEIQQLIDDNTDTLATIRKQRAAHDAIPMPAVGR